MRPVPASTFAFCCLAVWFAACSPLARLDQPEVTLDTGLDLMRKANGDYVLTSTDGGVQPIYIGTRPVNIDWSEPYGQRQGKKTLISNPGAADRYFVGMTTQGGDTLIVGDRRLALEGANNFRDLGGIPTRDGRYVRWGELFRSDRLSALTPSDEAYLKTLGLKTIYDFRSEAEVAEDPDMLPEGDEVEYIHKPIYFDVEDTSNLKERIVSGEMSAMETEDILVEGNRLFATDMADRFQPFIDCLLDNKGPIVYHCTSGKDRTGFATMLLLSAIDVGRDTIVDDYMLSNYYRYEMNQARLKKIRYASLIKRKLDGKTIAPLMVVDERYINAAYDAIEERYGTVDKFLEVEYGLDEEKRAQLIEAYTYGPAVRIGDEVVPADEGDVAPDSSDPAAPLEATTPGAGAATREGEPTRTTTRKTRRSGRARETPNQVLDTVVEGVPTKSRAGGSAADTTGARAGELEGGAPE